MQTPAGTLGNTSGRWQGAGPPIQDQFPHSSSLSGAPSPLFQDLLADLTAVRWSGSSRPAVAAHENATAAAHQQQQQNSSAGRELDAFKLAKQLELETAGHISNSQTVTQVALMTVEFGKKNKIEVLTTHPICRFICQRLQVSIKQLVASPATNMY